MNKRFTLKALAILPAVILLYLLQQAYFPYAHKQIQLLAVFLTLMTLVSCLDAILNKKEDPVRVVCSGVILIGIILRITYMLYTQTMEREYDLGDFSPDACQSGAYFLKWMTEHKLPEGWQGRFSHPPFSYIISGEISLLINRILHRSNPIFLIDSAKVAACAANCLSLLFFERLCEECGSKSRGKAFAVAVTAFLPFFYLSSTYVNSDAFTALFMILETLFVIRWYRTGTLKQTILTALIFGCGIMTNYSCVLPALLIPVLFIRKLRIDGPGTAGKFVLFSVISIPLGGWYYIRSAAGFGMHLCDIPDPTGEQIPETWSFFSRLFTVDFKNMIRTPYTDPLDYNAPVYLLKTALFGKFGFTVTPVVPILLLGFAFLLAVILAVNCLRAVSRRNSCSKALMYVGASAALLLAGLYVYDLKYPCIDNADYRLIADLFPFAAIPAGEIFETEHDPIIKDLTLITVIGFAAFSAGMYLMI